MNTPTDQTFFADGVYFGLPEDDYHADPALGSSGIKDLNIDPLTYWKKSPLNPDREEKEDTPALMFGDAVHKLLLEGPDVYRKIYAEKPEGMSFSKKDGKAWKAEHDGFKILDADQSKQLHAIKDAADRTGLTTALQGGFSEVSVFWTDDEGFRRKARFDKLKVGAAIDLKTFENTTGRPLDDAVGWAIAQNGYLISGVWYSEAINVLKDNLNAGNIDVNIDDEGPSDQWIDEFLTVRCEYYYVFIQKGIANNIVAKRFSRKNLAGINEYYRKGEFLIELALDQYRKYMKSHGPNKPWHDPMTFDDLADEQIPGWHLLK